MPAGGDLILARHVETRLATAELTADTATYTAETVALTATAFLEAGQTYAIQARGIRVSISGTVSSSETAMVRIREDTVSGAQLAFDQIPVPTVSGNGYGIGPLYAEYTATTTGSKSFVLTGQRNGGTANQQLRAAANARTLLTVDLIP